VKYAADDEVPLDGTLAARTSPPSRGDFPGSDEQAKKGETFMKPRVFVSRMIPQEGLDIVLAACDAEVNADDRQLSQAELIDKVTGKDGMLCLLTDDINDAILDASPQLKVVANVAVGYDNIDVQAATRRKIIVTNTPESSMIRRRTSRCLILASARRLVEADRYARGGKYTGWGSCSCVAKTSSGRRSASVASGVSDAAWPSGRGF
jgi:lactate dehydrogenase-like 2-hydroxyacid dehydrogenase